MFKTKFFLLLSFIQLISIFASARQRTDSAVQEIAKSVLAKSDNYKSKSLNSFSQKDVSLLRSSDLLKRADITKSKEAFFVCQFADLQDGFVLVSGDDRMPAILAMSEDGGFRTDDIPENLQGLMNEYAEAFLQIERGISTASQIFGTTSQPDGEIVKSLLGDIAYNQGNPYNLKVPTTTATGTKHCATGCVATAYAQIMRYYQWPKDYCKGSTSYVSTNLGLTISYDFSKVKFDWDNMRDKYTGSIVEPFTGTVTPNEMDYMVFANIRQNPTSLNKLRVDSLLNISGATFSGTVQLLLADNTGKLLQPVGNALTVSKSKDSFAATTITPSMPGHYENGTYRLYLGCQKTREETWSIVKLLKPWSTKDFSNKHEFYLTVHKKGSKFSIEGIEGINFDCDYDQASFDAVAELMAACGAAVSMQYGSSSSASTSNIVTSANKYFDYDSDAVYLNQTWCNTDLWHQTIQRELLETRPVIIRGTNDSGGGHCFIIDGYKYTSGVPYYHVNWGWGGSSQGYFLITMLKPSEAGTGGSSSNYSHSNAIIINFTPNDGINKGCTLGLGRLTIDDTTYVLPGGKINVTMERLQNLGVTTFAGSASVYLQDSLGRLVANIPISFSTTGLKTNYYLTSTKTTTYTVPSTLPLGDYKLVAVGKCTDTKLACEIYSPDAPVLHIVAKDPNDKTEGIFCYKYNSSLMTASVKGYDSPALSVAVYKGDLEIPETVKYEGKEYVVTGIENNTFQNCKSLTSIKLPKTLCTMGTYVFQNCIGLKSIVFPDSVSVINNYAFDGCINLKEVVFPKTLTKLGNYAFQNCSALTEAILPDKFTTFGLGTYKGCTSLTKLRIPEGVSKILSSTFSGCTSLKVISLPTSVNSIGSSAFNGCSGLNEIHVGAKDEVPNCSSKAFDDTNNCPIYVTSSMVEAYKTAWSSYATRIVGETPSAIQNVKVESSVDSPVYDLNGLPVSEKKLRKGTIYVINGKKQLVH